MNLERIREFCKERPGGLRGLAEQIDMSPSNLHRCINNNNISSADLERIALALHVDVRNFFDPAVSSGKGNGYLSIRGPVGGSVSHNVVGRDIGIPQSDVKDEIIAGLREQLAAKDALIAEKERLIGILLDKNENR